MLRRLLRALFVGPEATRIRRFVVVGLVAAGFQTALLGTLVEWWDVQYLLAAVCSIEATIVVQYGANNRWTFHTSRHTELGEYVRGLLRTNLVRGTAIPIQLGVLYALVSTALTSYLIANAVGIAISGVYRYVLDSRWTWRG